MKTYIYNSRLYFLPLCIILLGTSSLHAQFNADEHLSTTLTEVTVRSFNGDTAIFAKANNIPVFIAKKSQNLSAILSYMQITPYQFSIYNDLPVNSDLQAGVIYYLRPKQNKSEILYHYKRPGESLWDISQIYGVKIKKLLKKNRMKSVLEVQDGQRINLAKKRKASNSIQIDEQLAAKEPIDPWLPIKQRFIIDYNNRNASLTGKAVVNNQKEIESVESEKQNIGEGIHIVTPNETVFSISKEYGITVLDLLNWNQLKVGDQLKEGALIYVANPVGKQSASPQSIAINRQDSDKFEAPILIGDNNRIQDVNIQTNRDTGLYNAKRLSPEMIETLEHRAIKGDYVYKLSDVYKVMPQDIIRWNQLKGKAWLYVDDKVIIKKIEGMEQNPRIHSVRRGETLYQISGIYNAKIKDLTSWNNLEDYTIYPGQDLIVSSKGFVPQQRETSVENSDANSSIIDAQETIKENKELVETLPVADTEKNLDTDYQYYTVQEGDDIYQVAAKYGQTIQNLRNWNDIAYGEILIVGQKIKVKRLSDKNLE